MSRVCTLVLIVCQVAQVKRSRHNASVKIMMHRPDRGALSAVVLQWTLLVSCALCALTGSGGDTFPSSRHESDDDNAMRRSLHALSEEGDSASATPTSVVVVVAVTTSAEDLNGSIANLFFASQVGLVQLDRMRLVPVAKPPGTVAPPFVMYNLSFAPVTVVNGTTATPRVLGPFGPQPELEAEVAMAMLLRMTASYLYEKCFIYEVRTRPAHTFAENSNAMGSTTPLSSLRFTLRQPSPHDFAVRPNASLSLRYNHAGWLTAQASLTKEGGAVCGLANLATWTQRSQLARAICSSIGMPALSANLIPNFGRFPYELPITTTNLSLPLGAMPVQWTGTEGSAWIANLSAASATIGSYSNKRSTCTQSELVGLMCGAGKTPLNFFNNAGWCIRDTFVSISQKLLHSDLHAANFRRRADLLSGGAALPANCSSYTSCASCLGNSDGQCAFCGSSSRCLPVTSASQSCSVSSSLQTTQCTPPASTCFYYYGNCNTCTGIGCTWCASTPAGVAHFCTDSPSKCNKNIAVTAPAKDNCMPIVKPRILKRIRSVFSEQFGVNPKRVKLIEGDNKYGRFADALLLASGTACFFIDHGYAFKDNHSETVNFTPSDIAYQFTGMNSEFWKPLHFAEPSTTLAASLDPSYVELGSFDGFQPPPLKVVNITLASFNFTRPTESSAANETVLLKMLMQMLYLDPDDISVNATTFSDGRTILQDRRMHEDAAADPAVVVMVTYKFMFRVDAISALEMARDGLLLQGNVIAAFAPYAPTTVAPSTLAPSTTTSEPLTSPPDAPTTEAPSTLTPPTTRSAPLTSPPSTATIASVSSTSAHQNNSFVTTTSPAENHTVQNHSASPTAAPLAATRAAIQKKTRTASLPHEWLGELDDATPRHTTAAQVPADASDQTFSTTHVALVAVGVAVLLAVGVAAVCWYRRKQRGAPTSAKRGGGGDQGGLHCTHGRFDNDYVMTLAYFNCSTLPELLERQTFADDEEANRSRKENMEQRSARRSSGGGAPKLHDLVLIEDDDDDAFPQCYMGQEKEGC